MQKLVYLTALIAVSVWAQIDVSRLSADALKADVSFLASDALRGRGTPSPGLEIAGEFIASQFRRAGLEPVGDDGYFQTAAFESVNPNPEGLAFTIVSERGAVSAKGTAMAILQASAVDLRKAAVVKVGAGELAGVTREQVDGKVLAIDSVDGQNLVIVLRQLPVLVAKLRPALVVLLPKAGLPSDMPPRVREVSTGTAVVPVMVIWDEDVRAALSPEASVSVHIAAPLVVPVKLRNLIGVLRGSDPALRDTYVLVTAHYDHLGVRGTGEGDRINNGANDDASGTASVIEIANTLASLAARPKRSIVFMAFFGEEQGLLGSRYYAAHPVFLLAKTVADFNLEHMGRTDVDGGTSVGLVNVTGFDYSTVTDAVVKAGTQVGVKVVKNERLNERIFNGSDNYSLAEAGVPAHSMSVGYIFPDYHKPGDEWTKLDYANMALVDRAVAVYAVADSTEAPQWKDIPQTQKYIKARQAQ